MEQRTSGYFFAASAYTIWGFLPLFWKGIQHIPPLAILSYRIAFSFVTAWILWIVIRTIPGLLKRKKTYKYPPEIPLVLHSPLVPGEPEEIGIPDPGVHTPRWGRLKKPLFSKKFLALSLIAAALITVNWFVYIFAVLGGFTLEASLGYFLTPLVNVIIGVVVLKERPATLQIVALALGFFAVVILTLSYGRPPYIALILSLSFGSYGYVKKLFPWGSIPGLGIETLWVLPLAVSLIIGQGSFSYFTGGTILTRVLLILAGPVTLAPLVFFASAARRIPLSTLGFFQYLSPSFMFLIGWLVFREPVSLQQLAAFGLIWTALGIFSYSILQTMKDL